MASDTASDLPVACTLSATDLRERGEDVVAPLKRVSRQLRLLRLIMRM